MGTPQRSGGRIRLALADLAGDVRLAVRSLSKARGFTIVAILSLALGIGINTALLSFVNATMFRPVPGIGRTDRLVEVLLTNQGSEWQEWAYPDFEDVRAAETPLEALAGWKLQRGSLGAGEAAETIEVMYVSANYFTVLGVTPARGRAFVPAEDAGPGQHPAAILSHTLWRDRFRGAADIVGSVVTLDRTPYTVIGVAPESFRGHRPLESRADLWVPLGQIPFLNGPRNYLHNREALWLNVLGRLREDAGADQATAALRTVFARLALQHPASNRDRGARAVRFGPVPARSRTGDMAAAGALIALAGLVLLVICGNIAGMMLARGASRVREIAVRMALGASSGRLARQLMADALVLAGAGGGIGVLLAFWATSIAASTVFVGLPGLDLRPDWTVLLGSLVIVIVATIAVGLLPAFRFSRPAVLASVTRDSGSGGPRVGRLHRIAASGQIALALLFLVTCGLFVRALERMDARDLGFEPRNLLTVNLDLATQGYDTVERGQAFLDRVKESVSSLPGVTSVAYADGFPLDLVGNFTGVSRADRPDEEAGRVQVEFTRVADGFFQAVGTPLLRGRGIERTDTPSAGRVVVIPQPLADRMWPGEEALGRQLLMRMTEDQPQVYTVVGITGVVASSRPTEDWPQVFVPLLQHYDRPRFLLVVRTTGDTTTIPRGIQSAVLGIDPRFPNPTVVASESLVARSLEPQRTAAGAAGALGLLALLLSAAGVYGVVRFAAASRTREFGIRIAIGATRGQILRAVLRDAVRLAMPGVIAGGMLAIGVATAMRSMLLGVQPADPISIAVATGLLVLVVLLASQGPARRASRIDAIDALRHE
jgi:predicted permease